MPDAVPIPSVAIVLRTKDRPQLLRRALRDVLDQTFTHWRLWIVNDGGDAQVLEAALAPFRDEFAERLSVMHNAHSRGMEEASNQAITASESTYIAVHDDDDTWAQTFLERTVAHLGEHPEDTGVAVRTTIIWERIEGEEITETGREIFDPPTSDLTLSALMNWNRFVPISFLYRRSAHETLGLFREDLSVLGDYEFHLRLLKDHKVGFLRDESLAFWHQRPAASGVLGNSVIAARQEHRRFDLLLREEHFAQYVRSNGMGLPLYLTRLIDDRTQDLHARFDDLHAHLRRMEERMDELQRLVPEHGVAAFLRRTPQRVARIARRLRAPRGS